MRRTQPPATTGNSNVDYLGEITKVAHHLGPSNENKIRYSPVSHDMFHRPATRTLIQAIFGNLMESKPPSWSMASMWYGQFDFFRQEFLWTLTPNVPLDLYPVRELGLLVFQSGPKHVPWILHLGVRAQATPSRSTAAVLSGRRQRKHHVPPRSPLQLTLQCESTATNNL